MSDQETERAMPAPLKEVIAKACCREDGFTDPEADDGEGGAFWFSYTPEAETIIAAIAAAGYTVAPVPEENKTAPSDMQILLDNADYIRGYRDGCERAARETDLYVVGGKESKASQSIRALADKVLSHRKPVQSWQLIETAPKDGTKILVTDEADCNRTWVAWWSDDHFAISARSGLSGLTHWAPLPLGPVSSQTIPSPSVKPSDGGA